jgi:hypothetical protein
MHIPAICDPRINEVELHSRANKVEPAFQAGHRVSGISASQKYCSIESKAFTLVRRRFQSPRICS